MDCLAPPPSSAGFGLRFGESIFFLRRIGLSFVESPVAAGLGAVGRAGLCQHLHTVSAAHRLAKALRFGFGYALQTLQCMKIYDPIADLHTMQTQATSHQNASKPAGHNATINTGYNKRFHFIIIACYFLIAF